MAISISNSGRSLLGIGALCTFFATIAVCARFWSRLLKRLKYCLDDWFMLVALPCFYSQVATQYYSVIAGGLGFHEWQNSTSTNQNAIKSMTVMQYPYALTLTLVRLSICVLLRRIFIQKWLRVCMNILIFLDVSWGANLMIAASLVCQPMAYSWNPSIPGGSCNEDAKNGIYAALCGYTILHNVVIWSIPQVLVWRLPMSTANKIGLSAIFALGILDIGIAIVRLTAILTLNHDDYSYTIAPQQVASVAEVGIAIIVSNAPTMRPAIGACRDKLRTSRRREATSNTSVVQISAGSYEQLGDVNTQLSNDLRPDRGNTATVIEANASTEKTGRSSLSHHFPRRGTDVEQGITVKNEMAITYNK